jgi:predicted secreted protein
MITLTHENNGQSIEVQSGDIITIRLDENPTTGYTWKLEPENLELIELTQSDFVQNSGTGVGGGGQHIFTFKAMKAGVVSLNLKNWREWEGDRSIISLFTAKVKVNG